MTVYDVCIRDIIVYDTPHLLLRKPGLSYVALPSLGNRVHREGTGAGYARSALDNII